MFRATMAIMICAVLVSCGRIDHAQQQRIRVGSALRQFMMEVQIALVEQSPTNVIDVTTWAESFSSSTNKPAKELRSLCEVVWMDNNVSHWLSSVNSYSNTAAVAMIGQYQYEGSRFLIGISFSGDVLKQNSAPEFGFFKLDLRSGQ